MSSLAALIGTVCVCCVAVSILTAVSPNGMTSKTLNLVIGVFIVCVMIIPLKNFITNFNLDIKSPKIPDSFYSDAQNAYNSAVITETENRLEKTLFSILLNDDFNVKNVDIKLTENKSGGIIISSINIYINKTENNVMKIIRRTEEEFAVTPMVTAK
ncbi:MAG: stage III sporulation protein AF [Ruminococcus sp.]|nr:stage III sporulation protein AF [Ruminococcus sp.]